MEDSIKEIGDRIANLTLIQAVQLGEYLETVHGIKASKGVPQFKEPEPPPVEKVEQVEWSVILDGFEPDKKIGVIKVFREISGLGLKEAKEFVETGAGKPIKENMAHGEAEILKAKLVAAGAKITIK